MNRAATASQRPESSDISKTAAGFRCNLSEWNFAAGRTRSAKELAAKAVVLINLEQVAGKVVWPVVSPSE